MENGCVFCPNRWSWQLDFWGEPPVRNVRRLVRVHWSTRWGRPRLWFFFLRSSDVLCCANIRRNGSPGSLRDERSFSCLTLSAPTSANNRGTVRSVSLMAAGCLRLLCPISAAVSAVWFRLVNIGNPPLVYSTRMPSAHGQKVTRIAGGFVDWTQNAMRHLLIFVNERYYRRRQQRCRKAESPSIMEYEDLKKKKGASCSLFSDSFIVK